MIESGITTRGRRPRRWIAIYLVVGVLFSVCDNLYALFAGKPTIFARVGSVGEGLLLLVTWGVIPALTWPLAIYYYILRLVGRW